MDLMKTLKEQINESEKIKTFSPTHNQHMRNKAYKAVYEACIACENPSEYIALMYEVWQGLFNGARDVSKSSSSELRRKTGQVMMDVLGNWEIPAADNSIWDVVSDKTNGEVEFSDDTKFGDLSYNDVKSILAGDWEDNDF